jgi:hypothetical protein
MHDLEPQGEKYVSSTPLLLYLHHDIARQRDIDSDRVIYEYVHGLALDCPGPVSDKRMNSRRQARILHV